MEILIIPDVHGREFWKEPLLEHIDEYDKVIFLGDYVDPYPDEGITRRKATSILDEIIEIKKKYQDKVMLLLGNHDLHYIYIRIFGPKVRYSSSHAWSIRRRFRENIELFKLCHEEIINGKRYLFSHAGLMKSWYERYNREIGDLTESNINKLLNNNAGMIPLSEISRYRSRWGGMFGSIVWSDLDEKIDNKSEAVVPPYDYQIFGHTWQEDNKPYITDNWACLDTENAYVINDKGEIKQV